MTASLHSYIPYLYNLLWLCTLLIGAVCFDFLFWLPTLMETVLFHLLYYQSQYQLIFFAVSHKFSSVASINPFLPKLVLLFIKFYYDILIVFFFLAYNIFIISFFFSSSSLLPNS
ncbi:hypothetical protein H8356DRAFT_1701538 [Neocallimastix lanati (nom. inval.)]|nr:hypothetical protein H8356DRAFT_1701538 [Neocallimastix sp. JGI-2020a]